MNTRKSGERRCTRGFISVICMRAHARNAQSPRDMLNQGLVTLPRAVAPPGQEPRREYPLCSLRPRLRRQGLPGGRSPRLPVLPRLPQRVGIPHHAGTSSGDASARRGSHGDTKWRHRQTPFSPEVHASSGDAVWAEDCRKPERTYDAGRAICCIANDLQRYRDGHPWQGGYLKESRTKCGFEVVYE